MENSDITLIMFKCVLIILHWVSYGEARLRSREGNKKEFTVLLLTDLWGETAQDPGYPREKQDDWSPAEKVEM